jgi:hypothetical protein
LGHDAKGSSRAHVLWFLFNCRHYKRPRALPACFSHRPRSHPRRMMSCLNRREFEVGFPLSERCPAAQPNRQTRLAPATSGQATKRRAGGLRGFCCGRPIGLLAHLDGRRRKNPVGRNGSIGPPGRTPTAAAQDTTAWPSGSSQFGSPGLSRSWSAASRGIFVSDASTTAFSIHLQHSICPTVSITTADMRSCCLRR